MPDGQPTGGKRKSPFYLLPPLERRQLKAAALCTASINMLALTGPLYMLLLYDRVLPAHDAGELLALTLLMLLLYALSAWIDLARQRAFTSCARRVDRRLIAVTARRLRAVPVRDIDQIRAWLLGQGPAALCDLPWLPLYIAVMFLLHPLFGALATAGALAIAGCLLTAARLSSEPVLRAARTAEQRRRLATVLGDRASLATHAAQPRRQAWVALSARLHHEQDAAARPTMIAAAIVRALRPAVQSATLGLGVYLAMAGACGSARILAAAIVLPRVLGPLELAITHWRSFKAAHESAARLHGLLTQPPPLRAQPAAFPARGVQIILRMRSDQARSARGAGARSMSSGLRPTAE